MLLRKPAHDLSMLGDHRLPQKTVKEGLVTEVVEKVDLSKLPISRHSEKDAVSYITADKKY